MVKEVTAFETEGGSVFTTQEEAAIEEEKESAIFFASQVVEKVRKLSDQPFPTTDFYNAAKLLYEFRELFIEAMTDFNLITKTESRTGVTKNGKKKNV